MGKDQSNMYVMLPYSQGKQEIHKKCAYMEEHTTEV